MTSIPGPGVINITAPASSNANPATVTATRLVLRPTHRRRPDTAPVHRATAAVGEASGSRSAVTIRPERG